MNNDLLKSQFWGKLWLDQIIIHKQSKMDITKVWIINY